MLCSPPLPAGSLCPTHSVLAIDLLWSLGSAVSLSEKHNLMHFELSAQRNETKTNQFQNRFETVSNQFQNRFETVLFQFHVVVRTVSRLNERILERIEITVRLIYDGR